SASPYTTTTSIIQRGGGVSDTSDEESVLLLTIQIALPSTGLLATITGLLIWLRGKFRKAAENQVEDVEMNSVNSDSSHHSSAPLSITSSDSDSPPEEPLAHRTRSRVRSRLEKIATPGAEREDSDAEVEREDSETVLKEVLE
ncbi:unnamed protein product, partial [Owenia fusiformis]